MQIANKRTLFENNYTIMENTKREPTHEESAQQDSKLPDKKHFEHFSRELDSLETTIDPSISLMNFYKLLFNNVNEVNLDMGEVLEQYKEATNRLTPSSKYNQIKIVHQTG